MDQRRFGRNGAILYTLYSAVFRRCFVVGQVKALFQDEIESSSVDCEDCKGFGKVEVALAADNFREDDCETCQGTGRVEWED